MDTIDIIYSFKFDDLREEVVALKLNPRSLELVNRPKDDLPGWTALSYHQCSHCPRDILQFQHCPVAINLVDVVKKFCNVKSHEMVDLEVVSLHRKVSHNVVAQKGISSLLGLLIATSGCPHTDFFKPMARFHLPLASEEDTLFRVTGMYLLAQYFRKKNGLKEDFGLHGLTRIYENMHLLNVSIAERLRSATKEDSSLNAVVVLDVFTHNFLDVIEEHLVDLLPLFLPYLTGYYSDLVADL